MKKVLSFVICVALVMSLAACFEMHPPADPAPPESEPASVSSEPENSEPEEPVIPLHLDYFDDHVITHADVWDKNEGAVSEWAKYVYQEFGISEANAAYIGGNVGLSANSDSGCIDVRDYRVLIKADMPIPDSYDKGDDEYVINVISIAAAPDTQTDQTVIDILTPDRFNLDNRIDALYECVTEDGRFVGYLLPYREDVLPEGTVLTNVYTLPPENSARVWRPSRLMDDGTYASAYVHSMTEHDGAVAILFVNAGGYKTVETGIRACFLDYYENIYPWGAYHIILDDYSLQLEGNHIKMYRYSGEKINHLLCIYPDGTVREYGGDEAHTAYYTCEYPSDDGKHLIIQEFDSVYLADGESRELLLQMTDEERGEGKFAEFRNWTFVDWLDNDRFICGITGYMGIEAYYIYDLGTRSLTQFETVDGTFVQGVKNGKIIFVPNAMVTASTDMWAYDPDTDELTLLSGIPVDLMSGSVYNMDDDIFVSAEHDEYPYGNFTIRAYDPSKGEVVKTVEGYLHHNHLAQFVYLDGKLCGLIEAGPFTPTYYAVFE